MSTLTGKPQMPSDQDSARYILRNRWGISKNLTAADAQWLADRFPSDSAMTSVEMALRLAGWWEDYVSAGEPKWAEFRAWLIKQEGGGK